MNTTEEQLKFRQFHASLGGQPAGPLAKIVTFVLGAAHGVSLEYLSREVIDTDETMAMVQSGHPVYSGQVDEVACASLRDAAGREGVKGVLTLPILFQNELIGIMRLLTRSAGRQSRVPPGAI